MSTTTKTTTCTSGGTTTTTTMTTSVAAPCAEGIPPSLPTDGSVKVYYWPATGLAETIRLTLADAGIPWQDINFEKPADMQFGVYETPTSLFQFFGCENYKTFCEQCRSKGGNATTNIPMLEVNGKFYTQSKAVSKFVARRTDIYPSDPEEAFIVDNIIEHVTDAKKLCYEHLFGKKDGADFTNEAFLAQAATHLGNLERLVGADGAYFTGTFSLADVFVFDCVHLFFEAQNPGITADYPGLSALCARVLARPNIATYLASDQCARIDRMVPFS